MPNPKRSKMKKTYNPALKVLSAEKKAIDAIEKRMSEIEKITQDYTMVRMKIAMYQTLKDKYNYTESDLIKFRESFNAVSRQLDWTAESVDEFVKYFKNMNEGSKQIDLSTLCKIDPSLVIL